MTTSLAPPFGNHLTSSALPPLPDPNRVVWLREERHTRLRQQQSTLSALLERIRHPAPSHPIDRLFTNLNLTPTPEVRDACTSAITELNTLHRFSAALRENCPLLGDQRLTSLPAAKATEELLAAPTQVTAIRLQQDQKIFSLFLRLNTLRKELKEARHASLISWRKVHAFKLLPPALTALATLHYVFREVRLERGRVLSPLCYLSLGGVFAICAFFLGAQDAQDDARELARSSAKEVQKGQEETTVLDLLSALQGKTSSNTQALQEYRDNQARAFRLQALLAPIFTSS